MDEIPGIDVGFQGLFGFDEAAGELDELIKKLKDTWTRQNSGPIPVPARAMRHVFRAIKPYLEKEESALNEVADYIAEVVVFLRRDCGSEEVTALTYLLNRVPESVRARCTAFVLLKSENKRQCDGQITYGHPVRIVRKNSRDYAKSDEYAAKCEVMREDMSHIQGVCLAFDLEGVLVSNSYRDLGFKKPYINILRPGANEMLEALCVDKTNHVWLWTTASAERVAESQIDAGLNIPPSVRTFDLEATKAVLEKAINNGSGRTQGVNYSGHKIPRLFPYGDLNALIDDNAETYLMVSRDFFGGGFDPSDVGKFVQVRSFMPNDIEGFRSAHLDDEIFRLAKRLRAQFGQ